LKSNIKYFLDLFFSQKKVHTNISIYKPSLQSQKFVENICKKQTPHNKKKKRAISLAILDFQTSNNK